MRDTQQKSLLEFYKKLHYLLQLTQSTKYPQMNTCLNKICYNIYRYTNIHNICCEYLLNKATSNLFVLS